MLVTRELDEHTVSMLIVDLLYEKLLDVDEEQHDERELAVTLTSEYHSSLKTKRVHKMTDQ